MQAGLIVSMYSSY